MTVSIQADPEFQAGAPGLLFEKEYKVHQHSDQNYDVSRDGQHFAMIKAVETTGQIHVVLNWIEELKRKMSAGSE